MSVEAPDRPDHPERPEHSDRDRDRAGRRERRRAAREERIAHTSTGLTLAIIMLAAFVQLIDVSIVNVAIPSIQRDLNASFAEIQFVVAGYLLAFAMTLITGARLGDIYGRKRLFIIGMTGFTIASAVCGAAPNGVVLVVARIVQGAFSALMYPQVLSVIQVNIPPRDRGRAFGVLGAVIGMATILGPVLSGLLIAANIAGTTWRAIFYVNLPIGIIAVWGAITRLPESRAPDAPTLDVPGAILATIGVFLLIYPLVQGRQDGWPIWGWVMLASAVPVFTAFAFYERRRSREDRSPLVHASLVRDRAFVSGGLVVAVFFAGLPAFFFALSQYLQFGYGFSALLTGLTVFPFAAGNLVSSILSSRATNRMGTRVLSVGAAIVVLGMLGTFGVVHSASTDLKAVDLTGVMIVAGFGMGLFLPPVTNLILAGVHARAAGAASGVLATVQQVGGSLGVAIIGVVFYGVLANSAPAAAAHSVPRLEAQLSAAGLPPPAAHAVAAGFEACFVDRARANDPAAVPPSCARAQQAAAAYPAPPAVKAVVQQAVSGTAVPDSLAYDFRRAFQWALVYELIVFTAAGIATFALPEARPGAGHGPPAPAAQEAAGQA